MVWDNAAANTEFIANIHLSLADGYALLDEVGRDSYNEVSYLHDYIEHYHRRFGHYPVEVLVNGIYCTRENRHSPGPSTFTGQANTFAVPFLRNIQQCPGRFYDQGGRQ